MQASVRRFCAMHKTLNRGNGTEYLLRCCSAARILHSERPAFTYDCRSYGWVAQLAEQWTENPRVGGSIPPPATFSLGFNCRKKTSHSICRHARRTSAAALAEVAAIVWPATEHDYQVARSRCPRSGVVDSPGDDHRRVERSTFAAE